MSRGMIAFWSVYVICICALFACFYNMWESGNCRDIRIMTGVSTHYIWWDGCYIDQLDPPKKTNWKRAQYTYSPAPDGTTVMPTIPGTDFQSYDAPGYVKEGNTWHPTIPGTSFKSFDGPGFKVIPPAYVPPQYQYHPYYYR